MPIYSPGYESALYDPTYTPVTPRRKRRSNLTYNAPTYSAHSPAPSVAASSLDYRSNRTWTSSQYIRGLSVGPSHQQKAYDVVRAQYFVPQTTPPRKSLSNFDNLRPPPSYRHSMARMGSTTGLKEQDPYYYASRDYLSRTGSYYGTYNRPKYTSATTRPRSRVSQYYPGPGADIYSPSYGPKYGSAAQHQRQSRRPQYSPVIVESQDNLEEVKPLTKLHKAKSESPSPPVRAVVMGKTDVTTDPGVIDLEQKAEDIKGVVSPPIRAVQLGETEVSIDHGKDVIDLEQRVNQADTVVSPPVRAVQMGQVDVAHDSAADLSTDFDEHAEVAVDLDVGAHPVRAVQLGQVDVATDFAAGVADLDNPGGGTHAQKATVIEGDEVEVA